MKPNTIPPRASCVPLGRWTSLRVLLLLILGVFSSHALHAQVFGVNAAGADDCYRGGVAGTAFYLPGIDPNRTTVHAVPGDPTVNGTDGFRFVFSPAGRFEITGSTARLTGHVESTVVPGYGFDVDITFTGRTNTGSKLLELKPGCYVPPFGTGTQVDPNTWFYYADWAGTLTGTGNWAGAIIQVSAFDSTNGGHDFQVGLGLNDGASGKNVQAGAAGWFTYVIVQQPTNPTYANLRGSAQNGGIGDITINLNPCPDGPSPTPTPSPSPTPSNGTRTQGYWKTHAEAWCVTSITLGNQTYTRDQAIAIMQAPTSGDMTYALAQQLIAAKLNVGCKQTDASCISASIQAADAFLAQRPIGSKVRSSTTAWRGISAHHTKLDQYNNGLLCAPHESD